MSAATAGLRTPHDVGLGAERRLRLLQESDARELYALVASNREYLSEWMPWAPTQTYEATLEFIRRGRSQLAERQGIQLAIVQRASIVGTIGYHRIDWLNGGSSLGYWLAQDAQGQGTMTTAVSALVDHAFGAWKLNRIEIRAGEANHRSRAIPERLGFQREGLLREAELISGRHIDHVLYAMLARDWRRLS